MEITKNNSEIKVDTTEKSNITSYGNNIILFPQDRIVRPQTVAQFEDGLLQAKLDYIEYLVKKHSYTLFVRLNLDGVEIKNAQDIGDYVFVTEAIRAALYRTHGLEHPLHEFITANLDNEEVSEVMDEIYNYPEDLTN